MAHTTIADIVYNTSFAQYVQQRTLELSKLVQSGVAAADPAIAGLAGAAGFGGKTINLPYWNDLTGADEVLAEGTALAVNPFTAGQDVAVILRRGKAWGENDLAADIAGDDPARALGDRVAAYWLRRKQAALFATLKGVFANNVADDNSDHVLDITGESGSAALLDKYTLMEAAQLLGDAKESLTAIAMNSAAEAVLAAEENTALYRPSETPGSLSKYNGRDIIVDDSCDYNPTTKAAAIYLFGAGAVALQDVPERVPYEVSRDALYSRDVFVSRAAFICHLRGVKFAAASIAGATPTNAELATAASWKRVYEPKAVRAVKLICKLA